MALMGTVLQKRPGSVPRLPSALILLSVFHPVVGSGRAAGAGCLHRRLCRLLVLEEATEGQLGRFDPGAGAGIWLCSFRAPANALGAGPRPPVPPGLTWERPPSPWLCRVLLGDGLSPVPAPCPNPVAALEASPHGVPGTIWVVVNVSSIQRRNKTSRLPRDAFLPLLCFTRVLPRG